MMPYLFQLGLGFLSLLLCSLALVLVLSGLLKTHLIDLSEQNSTQKSQSVTSISLESKESYPNTYSTQPDTRKLSINSKSGSLS